MKVCLEPANRGEHCEGHFPAGRKGPEPGDTSESPGTSISPLAKSRKGNDIRDVELVDEDNMPRFIGFPNAHVHLGRNVLIWISRFGKEVNSAGYHIVAAQRLFLFVAAVCNRVNAMGRIRFV